MLDSLYSVFYQVRNVLVNYEWLIDTFDIIIVALLVYGIISQLRKTQSIQIIKGIIFVLVLYAVVQILGMKTISFLFAKLFNDIIIIFVVVFASEIRQGLERMGNTRFNRGFLRPFFSGADDNTELANAIGEVCRAAGSMSDSKTGSLIIFQRSSFLGDLTRSASKIDAKTSDEMLLSIFFPNSPLHDGAVVIRDGRIVAARCVVPMRNDVVVADKVGTRHRAALAVSMSTDAIAVVTSEETGIISLAVDGRLTRNLTESELYELLCQYLLADNDNNSKTKKSDKKKKTKKEQATEKTDKQISATDSLPSGCDTEKTVKIRNEGDVGDEQE